MSALVDRHCHHCNLPLLAGQTTFRVWCSRCSNAKGGTCVYCKGDVLDRKYCWETERLLDLALTGGTIGQTGVCGHCGTKLGVSSLTDTKATLICPRCGRMLTLAWTWSRKNRRGLPPVAGPDDPALPAY